MNVVCVSLFQFCQPVVEEWEVDVWLLVHAAPLYDDARRTELPLKKERLILIHFKTHSLNNQNKI